MKNIKKIMAVLLSLVLLSAVFVLPAHALNSSLGSSLVDLFGSLFSAGQNGDAISFSSLLQNPNGILDAIRQRLEEYDLGNVSDSQIVQSLQGLLNGDTNLLQELLSGNLWDGSFMERLAERLRGLAPIPTTEPTTEPTTVPETTEPTTLPPITLPSTEPYTVTPYIPTWTGAVPYTTDPVTVPTTEPAYVYVEPSTQTVPELTTTPIVSPVVVDDTPLRNRDGADGKMIAGIVILVVALGAVIAVAVMLKKTKV